MPKASSSKVTLDSLLAQERGKLPHLRPCTQADPTRDIDDYLLKVERGDWPKAIVKFFTDACESQGFFHCLKRECSRHPRFLPDQSHEFFRHLASKSLHGKEYPYGPIYYCRGRTKGDAEPCPFTNTQVGNATTHIKSIHLGIKSICEFCQKECRSDSGKLRHQERFHPKLLEQKRLENGKATASPSTSASTTPAPTTPTPPPTTSRRNKRKIDDTDVSEPEGSRAAPKRRRAAPSVARRTVPKGEPIEPPSFSPETNSPPIYEHLCHSFVPIDPTPSHAYTYSYPSTSSFPSLPDPASNWDTNLLLSTFPPTSTTMPSPPHIHDAAWKWEQVEMSAFGPLNQEIPAPTPIFLDVPLATLYNSEPSHLQIQQSMDLLDVIYPTLYANPFDPLLSDPLDAYSFGSFYGLDYSTNNFAPQELLTCTPGVYFN